MIERDCSMFKTKVGQSTNVDAFLLGKECAESVFGIGDVKVGLLFTNADMNQEEILKGAKSVFGNKPIIGCTSSKGLMTKDGLLSGESYGGMMSFGGDDLVVGIAYTQNTNNARELGKKLARDAINNAGIKKVPTYYGLFATPGEEENYIKGIEDVIGQVPFFGCTAGDNNFDNKLSLLCDNTIIKNGVAVVFFYSKGDIKNEFSSGYEETDKVGVITKLNGKRTISEIDHINALSIYSEWINIPKDSLIGGNIYSKSLLNPIGVKDAQGNITAVRSILSSNANESINVSNNVAINTAVIKLNIEPLSIINSAEMALMSLNNRLKKEAESYLLFEDIGRILSLGNNINELYNKVCNLTNGKEFLMVYPFGEFGSSNHSASTCGSLMHSFNCFTK